MAERVERALEYCRHRPLLYLLILGVGLVLCWGFGWCVAIPVPEEV